MKAYYLFVYRDFVEKIKYSIIEFYVNRAIPILNQNTSIFFRFEMSSV
jgi:hypothetical protein